MAALASPLRAFPASAAAASSSLRTRAAKPRGGRAASFSRVAVAMSVATTDEASARARTAPAGLGSTFTTWLLKEEIGGRVDGELAIVLSSVALACKQIASRVQRAPVAGDTGLAGDVNVQGEDQKKLDVVANEIFCDVLRTSGRTGVIASEEEDVPVAVEETYAGNYVVVFDPLDGSSNLDAAVSTGSIFGVYDSDEQCVPDFDAEDDAAVEEKCIANVCQSGNNLQAAGYCMYSSSTMLVLTVGDGVYMFTLDASIGEFVMSHERVRIPERGRIYSFNEGNAKNWSEGLKRYADDLRAGGIDQNGKPYSARYIGSLVGDFHRTLLYGGIYGYPGDAKNPNGKLRLLYEAGGMGSTGTGRVMDVEPSEVHQRVPFYVGSAKEVQYLESFLA